MKRFFASVLTFCFLFAFQASASASFDVAGNFGNGVPLSETLQRSGVTLPSNLPRFEVEGETSAVKAFESILLTYVIQPIFFLAGGVAVVVIMYSAGLLITGRGQEDSLTNAKTTLTWAFVGLGLVILAYSIVSNLADIILGVVYPG